MMLDLKTDMSNTLTLPNNSSLDIAAFSRIFEKTTNSYKYLFFLSLLDILARNQFSPNLHITFKNLVVEILANAWFPHTYFKLSFGVQDQIAKKLDSLNLVITEPILQFKDSDKKLLRKTIEEQTYNDLVKFLSTYVPYRLIRSFFAEETRGLKDAQVNQVVLNYANNEKENYRSFYHFDSDIESRCNGIILVPNWIEYIANNFSVIKGWASWEWLKYMQTKNPATPNLASKLFMPQKRGSLSSQTKLWKLVLEKSPIRCLYSGKLLDPENISLDHYLPWSFVAHDQPWNLIPILPEVNSSKSNNLPSEIYFQGFVNLQYEALEIIHKNLKDQAWSRVTESYVLDLNLNNDDLLDKNKLSKAYEETVKPLITLAERQGFTPGWIYKKLAA